MSCANVMFDVILTRLHGCEALFTIHQHAPSITIQDADETLWFPVEQLVKAIAFRIKGRGWALVGLCGYNQVDYKKLATALAVGRDKLMRLTPEEVEVELGYQLGGVAPFAPNEQTTVLLDAGVLSWPTIYCGVGRNDRTLEIAPHDLARIAGAKVHDLLRGRSEVAIPRESV